MAVFVFGSNLDGRHGRGAAQYAHQHQGAVWGQGIGHYGNSYALPTKGHHLAPMTLDTIFNYVALFLSYAAAHPELTFNVTRIGCGLAGHKDEEMAPMFRTNLENCYFPTEWKPWLGDKVRYHDLH
jgi:hypothetical protein